MSARVRRKSLVTGRITKKDGEQHKRDEMENKQRDTQLRRDKLKKRGKKLSGRR